MSRLPAPNSADRGGGGSHGIGEVMMCAPLADRDKEEQAHRHTSLPFLSLALPRSRGNDPIPRQRWRRGSMPAAGGISREQSIRRRHATEGESRAYSVAVTPAEEAATAAVTTKPSASHPHLDPTEARGNEQAPVEVRGQRRRRQWW